jgi:hypothetical protein
MLGRMLEHVARNISRDLRNEAAPTTADHNLAADRWLFPRSRLPARIRDFHKAARAPSPSNGAAAALAHRLQNRRMRLVSDFVLALGIGATFGDFRSRQRGVAEAAAVRRCRALPSIPIASLE